VRHNSRAIPIVLAISLSILLAGGCTNPSGSVWPSPDDALPRLEAVVERWRAMRAAGGSCEGPAGGGAPMRDCGRIRLELRRLASEFPRHPEVLFANAVVAWEAGVSSRAQIYLDALRRLRPAHAEASALRARLAMAEGNLPLARRLLGEAMQLSPAHPGLREAAASAAYLDDDPERAREHLRSARRLGAPGWRVAYHLGLVEEAAGEKETAARHYRRALDIRPGYVMARERLAGLERSRGPSGEEP